MLLFFIVYGLLIKHHYYKQTNLTLFYIFAILVVLGRIGFFIVCAMLNVIDIETIQLQVATFSEYISLLLAVYMLNIFILYFKITLGFV